MSKRERVRYQVWVQGVFPVLLRQLQARAVTRTGGDRITQGELLLELVRRALEEEKP